MTSFLFPATATGQGQRPRSGYGLMYTDIIRASADAVDALSVYRGLLLADAPDSGSVGYAAFDAHVGDTCCQVRAAMLLDLTRQHRRLALESGCVPWLDQYITKLADVRTKAQDMLAKLSIDCIHPQKLGIGSDADTPAGLLSQIGWSEPSIPSQPDCLYPQRLAETFLKRPLQRPPTPEDSDDGNTSSGSSSKGYKPFHHVQAEPTPAATPPNGLVIEHQLGKSYMAPLLQKDIGAVWDPLDAKLVVRFLVYCFVLSKYKVFSRFASVVGGRLHPEATIREGDAMAEPFWNKATRDYKHSKATRRINLELTALQTWMSELSCAWLFYTAQRSSVNPKLHSLLSDTLITSSKNITCMATYVGYLAIRELWGRDEYQMILVDRHYCGQGHHANFFLATLRHEADNSKGRPEHCLPLQHNVVANLTEVSKDWLLSSSDQGRPYIIVTGISIQGSHKDYMEANGDSKRHETEDCDENERHIKDFMTHDPDRLAVSFFAHHRQYTFDNLSKDDIKLVIARENEVVAEHMDKRIPGLSKHWAASSNEADEMGTGDGSMHMFTWQHCFVETRGRIARLVMDATNTLPIAAPFERLRL